MMSNFAVFDVNGRSFFPVFFFFTYQPKEVEEEERRVITFDVAFPPLPGAQQMWCKEIRK